MFNVNQITSELAKMADPMLQKYAALHKDDPYTVALAVGESNRRKAMRTAAQGRAAGQQQPKVVDQDIAQMAAVDPMGNMTGALPENMGIGRLPAPNMMPIGKAEGGIIGFAEGGTKPPEVAIKEFIDKYAQEYKVDPALLTQIVGVESNKKATAKNPKSSAHGLGQLVDTMWGKMGGGERTDTETQVRNTAKLLRSNTDSFTKANGRPPDPSEAYTTWFLGDPTGRAVLRADPNASVEDVIKKTDPKRADSIIQANKSVLKDKKVGDVMRWTQDKMAPVMGANTPVPFGSAEAAPVQASPPTTAQAAPQAQPINPKEKDAGPIAALGLPAIPAAGVAPRLLDKFAPSIVNDTAALKNALKTTARSGNVLAATTGLGVLATEAAGQNLKQLPQEQRRELANNALLSALSDHTGEAAAIMDAKANNPEGPSKTPYLQQMGNVGALIGNTVLGRNGMGVGALLGNGPKEPEVAPPPATTDRLSPQVPDELKRIEAAQRGAAEDVQVKPPEPPTAAAEGKTTGGGGLASLFKDPAFFMAMRLLANKNPDLGGAFGEAGIGTVGDIAAAEKAASESEYRKSMGKYYGSYADAIERGAKEKNEVQLAEKSAQEALDTWAKNNKMALLQSPGLYDQMRNKYRMDAYNVYGIKMPTAVAQQAAPNDPLGILPKG
jgi:hypothetical protein